MTTSSRAIRKDALRNRALLLDSADEVIRATGMDLSLNAVAHHAGVGVGTVYRHFPDREALVMAMFELRVARVCEVLSTHLSDEDPVAGLRATVFEICRLQATDRGVWEVISAGGLDPHRDIVEVRLLPLARMLVERANGTGRLRVPFDTNDLPVLLWTGGALSSNLGAVAPGAWLRYVQIMFDSFLADDDPVREPVERGALNIDQVDAAMRAWRR